MASCRGSAKYPLKVLLLITLGASGIFFLFARNSDIDAELNSNKLELDSSYSEIRTPDLVSHTTRKPIVRLLPSTEEGGKATLFYHVNIDYEKNLSTKGSPTHYLSHYQNPCWMSTYPNAKPGINPYANSPYIVKWIKRYIWGKEWYPMFERFMQDMTARVRKGENWRVRCTPGVYLIGSSKSGTDDLYFKMVTYHPDMHKPAVKEPLWWVHGRFGGSSFYDYLDGFDRSAEEMRLKTTIKDGKEYHPGYAIDASSWYIYSYDRWRDIPENKGLLEPKYVLPHALKALHAGTKILAIIREPGARLYSQYRMKYAKNPPAHFDSLVRKEVEAMKKCIHDKSLRRCIYEPRDGHEMATGIFMRGSLYYPFLRDWIEVFGHEQVKIIRAEDYYADRVVSLKGVFEFLDLEPLSSDSVNKINKSSVSNTGTFWKRSSTGMLNSTKKYLDDFFSPFNRQLAELLGDNSFLWEGY